MLTNKIIHTPFLIITIATVTGIVLEQHTAIPTRTLYSLLTLSFILLGVIWYKSTKLFYKGSSFGICMMLFFSILGMIISRIHNPSYQPYHFLNQESISTQFANCLQFEVVESLRSSLYYDKYIIDIQLLDTQVVNGKALLKIKKDSTPASLLPGEVYRAFGILKQIPKPKNPGQFDYQSYLKKQYIHRELSLTHNQLKYYTTNRSSIHFIGYTIRAHITNTLHQYSFSKNQIGILNALLLGQKSNLDKGIINSFKDAGAMHILAVSGLHIGILLVFVNFILSPLVYIKNGSFIRLILVLLILWFYAILTGLSPSIVRAVTMFSLLNIATQRGSKNNIYNAIIISIFLIVCVSPMMLFEVGFQLSYVAVLAIIIIKPIIDRLYTPFYFVDKIIWNTLGVTIAAQIGLLPLSLYYFHQFPTLFFISNLLIIPLLGSLLLSGIVIIILGLLQLLPHSFVSIYSSCIDTLHQTVFWVANQKEFVLQNISFSWQKLVVSYLVLAIIIYSIKKFDRQKLKIIILAITLFAGYTGYENHQVTSQEKLIIFHNPKQTIIGYHQHDKLHIMSPDSRMLAQNAYAIQGYQHITGIKNLAYHQLKNIYEYQGKKILIIDENNIYNLKIQPDYILLSNSSKIHLEQLIKTLKPAQIIADASNYKSYLDRWEKTAKELGIPFYRTDKDGAYIFE